MCLKFNLFFSSYLWLTQLRHSLLLLETLQKFFLIWFLFLASVHLLPTLISFSSAYRIKSKRLSRVKALASLMSVWLPSSHKMSFLVFPGCNSFYSLMSCCSFIILFLAQCCSFPTLPFIQTISVYCLRIFYSSEKDPTHNYFAGCFQNLLSPLCSTRALCTFLHCLFFYLFMHVPPPLSWEDLGIRDNILLVFEFLPLQQYLTHSISPIHFINEWIF